MSIKTKKSFIKRLRVTRSGKLMARKPGQNHFNAKERSNTKSLKHRSHAVMIKNKDRSRFLATSY